MARSGLSMTTSVPGTTPGSAEPLESKRCERPKRVSRRVFSQNYVQSHTFRTLPWAVKNLQIHHFAACVRLTSLAACRRSAKGCPRFLCSGNVQNSYHWHSSQDSYSLMSCRYWTKLQPLVSKSLFSKSLLWSFMSQNPPLTLQAVIDLKFPCSVLSNWNFAALLGSMQEINPLANLGQKLCCSRTRAQDKNIVARLRLLWCSAARSMSGTSPSQYRFFVCLQCNILLVYVVWYLGCPPCLKLPLSIEKLLSFCWNFFCLVSRLGQRVFFEFFQFLYVHSMSNKHWHCSSLHMKLGCFPGSRQTSDPAHHRGEAAGWASAPRNNAQSKNLLISRLLVQPRRIT